jgi:polar amino acid transport system permease protein
MLYQLHFAPVFENFDHLLAGAWITIRLSFFAMILGLVVGVVLAFGKTSGPAPLRWLINAYIELIRNTPFLAQIYFIYFALPEFGLRMTPNMAAIVALVVNVGAFATEIIRAGIESIAKGQVEAGIALGLKPIQIFRYIIIKPALRTIYPALTSQFIYLMLSTSVVSVISATDLTAAGNDVQTKTFTAFEVYLVVTAMYFIMSLGFSSLFGLIQRLAFNYPLSR